MQQQKHHKHGTMHSNEWSNLEHTIIKVNGVNSKEYEQLKAMADTDKNTTRKTIQIETADHKTPDFGRTLELIFNGAVIVL